MDVVARLIAGELRNRLGQAIIIDNKPGAGWAITDAAQNNAARVNRRVNVLDDFMAVSGWILGGGPGVGIGLRRKRQAG